VNDEEALSADGPVAAVQRYIDAFNDGDVDAMAACFAAPGSILDGMAPHVWRGPSAARDWYRDVLAEGRHAGAGDYRVTLGPPRHANVTGDVAYVVWPATMTFALRGQPVTQSGATFTAALQRDEGRWRIASWAWSKGQADI
jgi:ketosteroid isomerase-like protein